MKRKIKLAKLWGLVALIAAMTLIVTPALWALPYYESGYAGGSGDQVFKFFYYSGNKRIQFADSNLITGPSGDTIANGSYYQAISGTYQFGSEVSSGVYELTKLGGGTSAISVTDGSSDYLAAQAQALQINFNNHTITWSDVTNVSINNTIGSQALTDLASASTYAFTSFTFQAIANESAWLSGSDPSTKYTTYYSKLEGFAAVPEPATWLLISMGMGAIGFALAYRRRFIPVEMAIH